MFIMHSKWKNIECGLVDQPLIQILSSLVLHSPSNGKECLAHSLSQSISCFSVCSYYHCLTINLKLSMSESKIKHQTNISILNSTRMYPEKDTKSNYFTSTKIEQSEYLYVVGKLFVVPFNVTTQSLKLMVCTYVPTV